ncbi:MAG TPA: hypothetical protein VK656_03565 [Candidatus Acidoferrum sp.]|jgi:hypothetical protein|nr:hypothetical protein [Candidatus Acidoferrum sp.]
MEDRSQVSPRKADGTRGRRPLSDLRIGRFRVTPTRVMLVIALIGPLVFIGYAVTVRDATQIPLLVGGLAVLGIVFAALAASGAVATYRAAVDGRSGRAFLNAFLGGIAGVIAFGCFAWAIIGALAYQAPKH